MVITVWQGLDMDDDELLDLVSEQKSMSKVLHEYLMNN